MDKEVKKKLARNWFGILQQVICKDIEEIEKKKIFSDQIFGKEELKVMRAVVNLEYLKMGKFLKKSELTFQKFTGISQKNLKIRYLEPTKIQDFGHQVYLL